DSLAAVDRALRLRPPEQLGEGQLLSLRNEVLAGLSLADFGAWRSWEAYTPETTSVTCDAAFARYAQWGERGDITIRSVADGQVVGRFKGQGAPVIFLRFSPDGRYLAAAHKGNPAPFRLWDLPSGRTVVHYPKGTLAVGFRPDCRQIAVGQRDDSIILHDLPSGARAGSLPKAGVPPTGVTFDPEGKRLAVHCPATQALHVPDAQSGRRLARL